MIRMGMVILLSLFSTVAFAWNALGHMVIAQIAYQQVKPDVRQKINELMAYFHSEYPEIDTFQQSAYWPDALRSQRIETFTHWHYIDVPFSDDGTALTNTMDTDNAVWATKNIKQVIRNENSNPYEHARFLAFFAHIIGDLHQPLHTVSRISAEHPDGDKGGNLFHVYYEDKRITLHKLWDGGVGTFEGDSNAQEVRRLANALMTRYPKSHFGKRADDLELDDWVKEGENNAKRYVYKTPQNSTPSRAYLETGKALAEEEVTLAGYRLAASLNQLL